MEFNNIYYLEEFPEIMQFAKQTEIYANKGDMELAYINLRRVIENICSECLKADTKYKTYIKDGNLVSLFYLINRLYELKGLDKDELVLFQNIRIIANEYVHGTRDASLLPKDKKQLNIFCTELNVYFKKLPVKFGKFYSKDEQKVLRDLGELKKYKKTTFKERLIKAVNVLFDKEEEK